MRKFTKYFLYFVIIFLAISYFIFNEGQYYFGEKSNHFDGKKFFNPHHEDVLDKNILSYFASKLKYEFKNGKPFWPSKINTLNPKAPQNLVDKNLIITFVGHSSFLIQFDKINILTDPIWSLRASPISFLGPKRVKIPGVNFEDLPKIDAVLISHSHYDHLDLPTIKNLHDASNPQIFAGLGICYYLNQIKKMGVRCQEMDWNDKQIFNQNLTVNFLRAKHWSKRAMWGRNSSLWGAFALETKFGNVYFAGDTGYDDHFQEAQKKFGKFRIALLPIGAYKPQDFMIYHHISPSQAIQAHKELNSQLSIAMHFETFKLASDSYFDAIKDLKKELKDIGLQDNFITLEVGESLAIDK